ncbi:hypothetical protein B0A48_17694 [Cryoendolithus antarcticus]|uniref:3-phytase n=1 Tax=Cryoendolithus antarcticus TaxID=1507870 RepID=A0A1V8SB07_9PEZI|nr:hypothetical protein B0A48_17694 [Cryoendolithus antarcticus]
MTTLVPREPYSPEEVERLYPQSLRLRQVQVLLRHGERTPVSARFKNAGLAAYWPYCQAANEMKSAVMSADSSWDTMAWRRRLEVFDRQMDATSGSDSPALTQTSKGQVHSICQPGELTDRGRETTLALGERLRSLYVGQLGFLPSLLDAKSLSAVYLRATPIPRALESTQQAFRGLYPLTSRSVDLPPPVIVQRAIQDETLFPNEGACKRFGELAKAFADRTAQILNPSSELAYINKRIGKYMPVESPIVKVDSHPRLSGVMDTINATLAHGPATKLPSEFYDDKVRADIDSVCVKEWFVGYTESSEYRKLGIGSLVGDLTQNFVKAAQSTTKPASLGTEGSFKISLSGCHDTTLAAALAALGAYDVNTAKWPPYTSSIAFELFQAESATEQTPSAPSSGSSWWSSLFASAPASTNSTAIRTPVAEMTPTQQSSLDGHFVRVRYNDTPMTIPYCRAAGRHLEGDESFCTLRAFKEAADAVTPRNWKEECRANLGQPALMGAIERPPGL